MNVAFYRIYLLERHIHWFLDPMPGPPLPPCAAGRVSYPRESFRGNPSRQYALSMLSAVTMKA
jgi:hypothetical protein